jgi:hypothetical protein
VINRFDARLRGAAVALPVIDSGWFEQNGSVRSIALLVGLAGIAILALLVAGAAHRHDQRSRSRKAGRDDELFTTTPLPVPEEELARLAKGSPHHAHTSLKLPRWVQIGSLLAALGITWMVSQRIQPNQRGKIVSAELARSTGVQAGTADRARGEASDSPEDLDLLPDSAPPFSFRANDWVASGTGCAGRLEVTRGEPSAWNLTARVHDGQGQFLDSARTRVATLRPGDVVEFTFARANCDRIGAWDVRGDRRRD